MRKLSWLLLLSLLPLPVLAQTGPPPHAPTYTIQLKWTASTSPNVTYNLYEGAGPCSTSTTASRINASPITASPFTDPTPRLSGAALASGASNPTFEYCYLFTAVSAVGIESVTDALTVDLTQPAPPTNATGVPN